ncbi:MAG: helix-turn-helix transcriptional regulator [Bacteroidales bacterium]|nr:helix-turn-helix transcriptional regulator [Candidatus Equibacterium intestinale]
MISSSEKRRMVIAQQLASAMERKGLSKSQLADAVGRSRSEVTRWLSGSHNFTSDLLAELSQALGEEITGVSSLVDGYGAGVLCDPAAGAVYLDSKSYQQAAINARKNGTDIAAYIKALISKDSESAVSLPKVDFSSIPSRLARKYSGCVTPESVEDCEKDERFERIWNR